MQPSECFAATTPPETLQPPNPVPGAYTPRTHTECEHPVGNMGWRVVARCVQAGPVIYVPRGSREGPGRQVPRPPSASAAQSRSKSNPCQRRLEVARGTRGHVAEDGY